MKIIYKGLLALSIITFTLSPLFCDGDVYEPPIYTPPVMKMYPASVSQLEIPGKSFTRSDFIKSDEDVYLDTEYDYNAVFLERLTRDSFNNVVVYYKKLMNKQDTLEEKPASMENQNLHTVTITYYTQYKTEKVSSATVVISEIDMTDYKNKMKQYGGEAVMDAMLPYPLVLMRNLIGMYGHTQEEFDAIKKKYSNLTQVYTRKTLVDGKEKDQIDDSQMKFMKVVYGAPKDLTDEQFEAYMQKASMNPKLAQRLFAPEVWTAGLQALSDLETQIFMVKIEHTNLEFWQ